MTEELCRVCRHARRRHSYNGCAHGLDVGTCDCTVPFTSKTTFITGTALDNWSTMGIDEIIGVLTEANLKANEVDAAMAQLLPMLRNAEADLADVINLNAMARGNSQNDLLLSAAALFQEATDAIGNAAGALDQVQINLRAATDKQSDMIGRLG